MDRATRMLEQLTVKPGTRVGLDDRDPAWKRRPAHRLDTASPVVAPTGCGMDGIERRIEAAEGSC